MGDENHDQILLEKFQRIWTFSGGSGKPHQLLFALSQRELRRRIVHVHTT